LICSYLLARLLRRAFTDANGAIRLHFKWSMPLNVRAHREIQRIGVVMGREIICGSGGFLFGGDFLSL
jgi:hypothetical protein